MGATITWNISQMDCYPQVEGEQDVVFTVHWTCSGVQTVNGEPIIGSVYNTTAVSYEAGTPYTPYANLTQDQVLGWVWSSGVDKNATETAVRAQINNTINPPVVVLPNPWAV